MTGSKVEVLVRGLGAGLVDGALPDHLRTISNLLNSLLLLAKSIQDVVCNDESLSVLRIGIFAKAIECVSATTVPNGVHTLMGPNTSQTHRTSTVQVPLSRTDADEENGNTRGNGTLLRVERAQIPSPSLARSIRTCSLPVHLVQMTQSLLLDAIGWTTHPYLRKYDIGTTLSVEFLKSMIQGIISDEKKKLKVKPGTNIKYETLLPEEYRNATSAGAKTNVQSFSVNLELPKVDICHPKSVDAKGFESLKLEMQKPDRLKKTEMVALLTMWLKSFGPEGTCGSFLKKRAQSGLTGSRCTPSKCGGPLRCSNKPQPLNKFYTAVNGSRNLSGKGEVDPFCAFLKGVQVKMEEIVVRFSPTQSEVARRNTIDQDTDVEQRCPEIWKRKDVGRSTLLGELEEAVGTALVVGYPKIQTTGSGQVGNRMDPMDIGNAIVITDIVVEESAEQEIYPFREWYLMRNGQRRLRDMHFRDGTVPRKMKDLPKVSRAVLWHKGRMQFC